jgi:hypothetical protein
MATKKSKLHPHFQQGREFNVTLARGEAKRVRVHLCARFGTFEIVGIDDEGLETTDICRR